MLAECLYDGCSAAHRRLSLIFLDIFWKGLWLVITVALSGIFLVWIGSEIGSVTWEETVSPRTNPLLLLSLVREVWDGYGSVAFWGLMVLGTISAATWLFLEAYFRSQRWGRAGGEFKGRTPNSCTSEFGVRPLNSPHFRIFLGSGVARAAILFGAVLLLGGITFGPYLATPIGEWPRLWEDTRGVTIIAIVILAALAFLITVVDTLIRSDAVTLLATHMLEVAGLIGGLLMFEACIAGSAGIAVLIGILHAATPIEFFVTFTFAALTALVLTAIHSYLLLVRFLSIGIMRRNVDV